MAFPTHFRDKNGNRWLILKRDFYSLASEIAALAPGGPAPTDFPDADFIHNIGAPFEIHDLLPRACQIAGAAGTAPVADPPPDINAFWQLRITAVNLGDFQLTRAPTYVDNLVDRLTRNWHLSGSDDSQPLYLEQGQGYKMSGRSMIPAGGLNLRANVSLRGYVLTLNPTPDQIVIPQRNGGARG